MMEWEKKDDAPVRLKYKVVLNGASAPKNYLHLVLDPAEGSKTLNSVIAVVFIVTITLYVISNPVILDGSNASFCQDIFDVMR